MNTAPDFEKVELEKNLFSISSDFEKRAGYSVTKVWLLRPDDIVPPTFELNGIYTKVEVLTEPRHR
jgi:hypothetical protein